MTWTYRASAVTRVWFCLCPSDAAPMLAYWAARWKETCAFPARFIRFRGRPVRLAKTGRQG